MKCIELIRVLDGVADRQIKELRIEDIFVDNNRQRKMITLSVVGGITIQFLTEEER